MIRLMQATNTSLLITEWIFTVLTEITAPMRQTDVNFIWRGFTINISDSVITLPSNEMFGSVKICSV